MMITVPDLGPFQTLVALRGWGGGKLVPSLISSVSYAGGFGFGTIGPDDSLYIITFDSLVKINPVTQSIVWEVEGDFINIGINPINGRLYTFYRPLDGPGSSGHNFSALNTADGSFIALNFLDPNLTLIPGQQITSSFQDFTFDSFGRTVASINQTSGAGLYKIGSEGQIIELIEETPGGFPTDTAAVKMSASSNEIIFTGTNDGPTISAFWDTDLSFSLPTFQDEAATIDSELTTNASLITSFRGTVARVSKTSGLTYEVDLTTPNSFDLATGTAFPGFEYVTAGFYFSGPTGNEGFLTGYSQLTGAENWFIETPAGALRPMLASDGTFYVPLNNGTLLHYEYQPEVTP